MENRICSPTDEFRVIAGHLTVDPDQRHVMLDAHRDITIAARSSRGCHDFHLSPDPVETDRINIYERWASVDDVEAFRGSGPSDEQQRTILGADVAQYEIASTEQLS